MKRLYTYPLRLHRESSCRVSKIQALSSSALALPLVEQENPSSLIIRDHQDIKLLLADLLQVHRMPTSYYKEVHSQITVWGFKEDVFLANNLLSLYSKSGCLHNARALFDKMPHKNLITWSSMISIYAQHGYSEEALLSFLECLREFDEYPNEFILASIMRASTQMGIVQQGTQVHCFVTKIGCDQDVYVGTSLVDFYSKAGDMEEARIVFENLSRKSAVTWTSIMTGYVKSGRGEVSLQLFNQMRQTDVSPDKYVLSSLLSACSMLRFLEGGKQTHAYVLRRKIETDVSIVNVLIDFYVKCGMLRTGRSLFDQMVTRNVISWTTMIAGYMQNSYDGEAIKLFAEMKRSNWKPDAFACSIVLTSCGSLEALDIGKQVHCYALKANLEVDEFVGNGLIDMYAKCNSLADARCVFDALVVHNVVSYNAMIEGYSRHEKLRNALDLFHDMRIRLFPPSLLTFVSLLGASASRLTLQLSQQVHGIILKYGISLDVYAGSALIDVYCKCLYVKDARLVFDEMKERDIVVWNAMLCGYTHAMENEETLSLYLDLLHSRQRPNEFTFVALVTAASNLASLPHGQKFHGQLIKTALHFDSFITNALVDMYAKCGCIDDAHRVFTHASYRDVACWNSMISTYAHHNKSEETLQIFEKMTNEGVKPNYVTFVGLLTACSNAGLVEEGYQYFTSMHKFSIEPGIDHYASMVSLLGKAGKLHEAKEFIEKMPIDPAPVIWRSLLSACRVAGNIELGQYAAEKAISLDPADSGSYTLLSNIFASKGMWNDVKELRKKMELEGVVKEPGVAGLN